MKKINSVTREEWLKARKDFLIKEKEFTYAREKLSEERRNLADAFSRTQYGICSHIPMHLSKHCSIIRNALGWNFNWVSSTDLEFGTDFGVSFYDPENDGAYNYSDWTPEGEMPGISVFIKQDDEIYPQLFNLRSRTRYAQWSLSFLRLNPERA
ncbi:hypothetical protein GQR58_023151 [Nymphon striatum]|nr:hypothetical protein GQR58_023151 [Nymphon striatum]